jgi:RecA-family ATPase
MGVNDSPPTAGHGHDLFAVTYIRALLDGGSPNGTLPEAFGEYRDIIEGLVLAYSYGGTQKVREAWRDILRRHPDLAALVSGERAASGGWVIFTLADAYKPRPKLRYVVDGLFPLPSLSIVYGAPGTLKSLLIADMAVSVAAGAPWLPILSAPTTGKPTSLAPVLWCDFDNGPRTTHERFEALGRARTLAVTAPLSYVSIPVPWLDASNTVAMAALAERIHDLGALLVCIDNLTLVKGQADENSAQMGSVMANFRHLAEDTGAAVILIHHQRKNTQGGKGQDKTARAGDRLRGHSSIEAAVDLALLVEREPQSSTLDLQSTKTRGVDVLPFKAQFTYEHKTGTTELATARFFGMAFEDKVSDRAIEQAVVKTVASHPRINQKTLRQQVKQNLPKVPMHRINSAIHRLERQKKLTTQIGERGSKLYQIV